MKAAQPKLEVSDPQDGFEREADRIADEVVQAPANAPPVLAPSFLVQGEPRVDRQVEEEVTDDGPELEVSAKPVLRQEDDELEPEEVAAKLVQRQEPDDELEPEEVAAKAAEPGAWAVQPDATVASSAELRAVQSHGGRPLPGNVRRFMEGRLGRSLDHVRVHTDPRAAALARALRARAFAAGRDIVFAAKEFRPESRDGRWLIAHELAHVLQQAGSAVRLLSRSPDLEQAGELDVPSVDELLRLFDASPGEVTKALRERLGRAFGVLVRDASSAVAELLMPPTAVGDVRSRRLVAEVSPRTRLELELAYGPEPGKRTATLELREQPLVEGAAERSTRLGTAVVATRRISDRTVEVTDPAASPGEQRGADALGDPDAPPVPAPPTPDAANGGASEALAEEQAEGIAGLGDAEAEAAAEGEAAEVPEVEPLIAPAVAPVEDLVLVEPEPVIPLTTPGDSEAFVAFEGRAGTRGRQQADPEQTPEAAVGAAKASARPPSPKADVEAKAQDRRIAELAETAPKPFDAARREQIVQQMIRRLPPFKPESAEDFESFGPGGRQGRAVTNAAEEVITKETEATQKPVSQLAEAPVDTSGIQPKEVVDLEPEQPGAPPRPIRAKKVVPEPLRPGQVDPTFQNRAKTLDRGLATERITEDTLAASNEPEFVDALAQKQDVSERAVSDPMRFREAEGQLLGMAERSVAGRERAGLGDMFAAREEEFGGVEERQELTEQRDSEELRVFVESLDAIFVDTQTRVRAELAQVKREVLAFFRDLLRKQMDNFVRNVRFTIESLNDPDDFEQVRPGTERNLRATLRNVATQTTDLLIQLMQTRVNPIFREGIEQVTAVVAAQEGGLSEEQAAALEAVRERFGGLRDEVDATVDDIVGVVGGELVEASQSVNDEIERIKEENRDIFDKAEAALEGVLNTIRELRDLLVQTFTEALDAIDLIIADPIGFAKNFFRGIGAGFAKFIEELPTLLKEGLFNFLFGAASALGVQPPTSFDLEAILTFGLQILGLTVENFKARAREVLGDDVVDAIEKGVEGAQKAFELFNVLRTEGISGLFRIAKEKFDEIKTSLFDQIKEFVQQVIIEKGIEFIVSLLTPAGAFIKAVKAIIDVVTFLVQKIRQIAEFIQAITRSVVAIAKGNVEEMAEKIKNALGRAIPVLIGILASVLGLGDVPQKIQELIEAVRKPVNAAIDFVLERIKSFAEDLIARFTKQEEAEEEAEASPEPEPGEAQVAELPDGELGETLPVEGGGESHTIFFAISGGDPELVVSSPGPSPLRKFVRDLRRRLAGKPDRAKADEETLDRAEALVSEIEQLKSKLDPAARATLELAQSPEAAGQAVESKDAQVETIEGQIAAKVKELLELVGEDAPQISEDPGGGERTVRSESVGRFTLPATRTIRLSPVWLVTGGTKGTGTSSSVNPPGFEVGEGLARGHVIAKQFGGSGTDLGNLVTLLQKANSRMNSQFESPLRRAVSAGAVGLYTVDVEFGNAGDPIPTAVETSFKPDTGDESNDLPDAKAKLDVLAGKDDRFTNKVKPEIRQRAVLEAQS